MCCHYYQKSYNLKGIKPINMIMQYIYAGTLIATFLLAMGNRPVGAKWKYMAGESLPHRTRRGVPRK